MVEAESISEAAESDRESIDSEVSTSQTQDEASRPFKRGNPSLSSLSLFLSLCINQRAQKRLFYLLPLP